MSVTVCAIPAGGIGGGPIDDVDRAQLPAIMFTTEPERRFECGRGVSRMPNISESSIAAGQAEAWRHPDAENLTDPYQTGWFCPHCAWWFSVDPR